MATPHHNDEDLDASLFPIAVLLDELKNDDLQLRLNATRRIKTIADALGPERTRAELLPFLTEIIDDEDEVLLALAEELGDFLDEVGGPPHASVLVLPLETLSTIEETMVRDKAIASLRRLSENVARASPEDAKTLHVYHLYPLVRRLSSGDWFTSRISACALFSDIYTRIPDDSDELRTDILNMYKDLAHDETPMVRRAAASNIARIAAAIHAVSPQIVQDQLLPVFATLVGDEQDSVRLLVVENAAPFAKFLATSASQTSQPSDVAMSTETNGPKQENDEDKPGQSSTAPPLPNGDGAAASESVMNGPFPPRAASERIVDMVRGFSNDKSWRVRYMLADKLSDLCDALGPVSTKNDLLPAFLKVLKDNEPEVRTAAAFKVTEMTKRIVALEEPEGEGTTGLQLAVRDVLPIIDDMVADDSQHVRAALASNIMGLALELGVDVTVNHLVDVLLFLLKDHFPEVRLNVIARLDKVSFIMSIEKLSSELLPAIVDLAEDKNWRVRLEIINHIPLLARQLGRGFFEEHRKLGDLCISWLGDCVYSIREAAITNLKALTEVFGLEWAKEHIVPQVLAMYDQPNNYLLRMTSLHAIGVLSEVVGTETVEESFLPIVTERASKDPVPNVRFCSAKTLTRVIPYVRQDVRETKIRPCLMSLVGASEKDKDVNYFAQQALQKLGSCPT